MHERHWRRWRHHWAAGCGPDFAFEAYGPDVGGFENRFSKRHRREEDRGFRGGGSSLGVRRPLRYLAMRLDLSGEQVDVAARILEKLKIEREQASVDLRRATADAADAMDAEPFDQAKADSATQRRVEAARSVENAVADALRRLHELLEPEQRARLATLIRTGAIQL